MKSNKNWPLSSRENFAGSFPEGDFGSISTRFSIPNTMLGTSKVIAEWSLLREKLNGGDKNGKEENE